MSKQYAPKIPRPVPKTMDKSNSSTGGYKTIPSRPPRQIRSAATDAPPSESEEKQEADNENAAKQTTQGLASQPTASSPRLTKTWASPQYRDEETKAFLANWKKSKNQNKGWTGKNKSPGPRFSFDFQKVSGGHSGADLESYRGANIGKVGAIAASADQYAAAVAQGGMNIRKTPIPSGEVLGQIPVGQKVFVKAENQSGGWAFVVAFNGTVGWISQSYLRVDMPDPEATLHHVTEPNLTTILERHYHKEGRYEIGTGNDFATLAVAVAAANQGTQGVYVDADKIQQWADDNPIRNYDYIADNLAKYSAVGIRSGMNIWLPGASYVKSLQESGEIATRPDWANVMVEGGKMIAGFTAGFYNGIYENITDTLVGLWEGAQDSMSFLGNLLSGDLFASIPEVAAEIKAYCEGKSAADILSEIGEIISEMAGELWDNFTDNWSHPDEYKRWHFRGNLVGQIVLEVILAILTLGSGTAVKWGAKLISLSPKLVRLLGKVAAKARKLKPKARGIFKGANKTTNKLGNATRGRAAQKAKALAFARTITEMHDRIGSSLAELKFSLAPLERKYKVKYRTEPKIKLGHYRIVQRSPKIVDNDYTPGRRNIHDHEEGKGHTIERHVGKSDNWLRKRLRDDPEMKAASTFTNETIANRVQGRFVKQFRTEIQDWLKNGGGKFSKDIQLDFPIGRIIKQGEYHPLTSTKAKVVLIKNNSNHGFQILTSFPID